jgi:hypothetical protein
VHVALTRSPIKDADGRVLAGTAIARDITASARRRRGAAPERGTAAPDRRERARVRDLLHRPGAPRHQLEHRRRAAAGLREEEVLGEPADIIFTPEDRAEGAPEKEARTARKEGRPPTSACTCARTAAASAAPAPDADAQPGGEAVGFVKILRDLSAASPSRARTWLRRRGGRVLRGRVRSPQAAGARPRCSRGARATAASCSRAAPWLPYCARQRWWISSAWAISSSTHCTRTRGSRRCTCGSFRPAR